VPKGIPIATFQLSGDLKELTAKQIATKAASQRAVIVLRRILRGRIAQPNARS